MNKAPRCQQSDLLFDSGNYRKAHAIIPNVTKLKHVAPLTPLPHLASIFATPLAIISQRKTKLCTYRTDKVDPLLRPKWRKIQWEPDNCQKETAHIFQQSNLRWRDIKNDIPQEQPEINWCKYQPTMQSAFQFRWRSAQIANQRPPLHRRKAHIQPITIVVIAEGKYACA